MVHIDDDNENLHICQNLIYYTYSHPIEMNLKECKKNTFYYSFNNNFNSNDDILVLGPDKVYQIKIKFETELDLDIKMYATFIKSRHPLLTL